MRFLSTIVVVSLLAARPARADAVDQPIVQAKPSYWRSGPAGGAFGLFVEGGATAGWFVGYAFGAGSLGLGISLRWFEASFTGYYGSSFDYAADPLDGRYSAGGFLGRVALRVPAKYVAFTFGTELGYVDVVSGKPVLFTRGAVVEPLSVGVEIDPVCHLRISLLGSPLGIGYSDVPISRAAFTVGYVMGACSNR